MEGCSGRGFGRERTGRGGATLMGLTLCGVVGFGAGFGEFLMVV